VFGKFYRRQTGKSSWEEAKAVAAIWESSGWNGDVPKTPPSTEPGPKTTIERAVAAFLTEPSEISAPNTLRKNRFLLSKLQVHTAERGYLLIDQLTPMDVREFRASWKVSPLRRNK
jgi:hypothetical protein